MNNFVFGLQSIAYDINHTISIFLRHQLVWGFALGFAAATFINLFIMTDNLRHLPHFITKKTSASFSKLAARNDKGTYQISYSDFQKKHSRVRIIFYSALLAFFIVVIIALLRY